MKIDKINNLVGLSNVNKHEKIKDFSFKSFLTNSIEKINNAEKVSNILNEQLATGKLENIHDAMIATQKAEITLNLALELRGQVLDAYREIMRLQV